MFADVFCGVLIPFIGTTLGALCVFMMKRELSRTVESLLDGFAAGVMTAASVWSLLIPSIEQCAADMGQLAFIPAATGFLLGVGLMMLLDRALPMPVNTEFSDKRLMLLAVTIHNIPEGMAVGAIYAGLICGAADITAAGAFALALGIAIQNLPEGAIISMPLHAAGTSRAKSFLVGTLSGAVEPAGALLTIAAASLIIPAMPYLLSFAAGAMIYVVTAELIPEMTDNAHPYSGIAAFAAGFAVMMSLDVALG